MYAFPSKPNQQQITYWAVYDYSIPVQIFFGRILGRSPADLLPLNLCSYINQNSIDTLQMIKRKTLTEPVLKTTHLRSLVI
jgi:hypothetical protein